MISTSMEQKKFTRMFDVNCESKSIELLKRFNCMEKIIYNFFQLIKA